MNSYFKRVADEVLAEELAGMGAVLVQGPKWCGKTTTCEQLAKSVIYLNDPRRSAHYHQIAEGKATLKALADKIDTTKMPSPSFRMVLVATGEYAYQDKDGCIICPITCLRP